MTDVPGTIAPAMPTPPKDLQQQEYFGTDETYDVIFPDGVSKVTCKRFNEGMRAKYQNLANREVRVDRVKGDAHMKVAAGADRKTLLTVAIVGWNLIRAGQPVAFSTDSPGSTLYQWIDAAPPSIIDLIEKEIKKHETWMLGESTVEEIDNQIVALQELRDAKLKEEEGKVS